MNNKQNKEHNWKKFFITYMDVRNDFRLREAKKLSSLLFKVKKKLSALFVKLSHANLFRINLLSPFLCSGKSLVPLYISPNTSKEKLKIINFEANYFNPKIYFLALAILNS